MSSWARLCGLVGQIWPTGLQVIITAVVCFYPSVSANSCVVKFWRVLYHTRSELSFMFWRKKRNEIQKTLCDINSAVKSQCQKKCKHKYNEATFHLFISFFFVCKNTEPNNCYFYGNIVLSHIFLCRIYRQKLKKPTNSTIKITKHQC